MNAKLESYLDHIASLVDEQITKFYKLFPAVMEDQKDNPFDGTITCAVTSLSMFIQSLVLYYNVTTTGTVHRHLEDDILKDIRSNLKTYLEVAKKLNIEATTEQGLRTSFYFLQWYTKEKYGITLKVESLSRNKLFDKIRSMSCPFVGSTSHMCTPDGHIHLYRGWCSDDSGEYAINNDPYGEMPYKVNKSGEAVKCDFKLFPDEWKDKDGWKKAVYYTLGV